MLRLSKVSFNGRHEGLDPVSVIDATVEFDGTISSKEADALQEMARNNARFCVNGFTPAGAPGLAIKNSKQYVFGGGWTVNGRPLYITRVLYSGPATIVFWNDGTKTVSKCAPGDVYNAELGLSVAIMKRIVGADSLAKTFEDWLPKDANTKKIDIADLSAARKAEIKAARKTKKATVENK